VIVEEDARETSKHTGVELRVLRGTSRTIEPGLHAWFIAFLADHAGRALDIAETAGETIGCFSVSAPSWSRRYEDDRVEFAYQLELKEHEDLGTPTLVLDDDFALSTYWYTEQVTNGSLHIRCRTTASRSLQQKMQDLRLRGGYFPVVRKGLTDDVFRMRFGQVLWSAGGEERKYLLNLVESTYDEKNRPLLLGIEDGNARRSLAFYEELVDGLVQLLTIKNLLTEKESEDLRLEARSQEVARSFKYEEVREVDDLKLD